MADERPDGIAPLAERMRPEKIEDMVGQPQLLDPEAPFRKALESGRVFPVIFWGPPGSGKTRKTTQIRS